jgi:four helix bundle protein
MKDVLPLLPSGRGNLREQLLKATTSISLNLAEGAGRFAPADKAHFYRISRGSVFECAACLDAAVDFEFIPQRVADEGKKFLAQISNLLSSMILGQEKRLNGEL